MKNKNDLSVDQIEFACDSFKKWLQICESKNNQISTSKIDNSWLLRRLLSGKDVHDEPPMRFGLPAWELIDREEIEIDKFVENHHGIIIDDHEGYSWIDKNQKLIRYERLNLEFKLIESEQFPDEDFVDDVNKYKYHSIILKRTNK